MQIFFIMAPFTTIHLPQWDGGTQKIRFIYLANATSFKLTSPLERGMIPLFLGADLFSVTDIRSENRSRYHAKFAKKGLATKIIFSSAFRFHGLRVPTANNCLWFYSIQGLFRIAFELYSKQQQLTVLEHFQDVWKAQIDDSPLEMSYNLSVQVDPSPQQNITEMYDKDLKLKLITQHSHDFKENPSPDMDIPLTESGLSGDSSADHDYCSPLERPSTLSQKLQSLEAKLSAEGDLGMDQRSTILLLLEHIEHCVSAPPEERDLADTVIALLESKATGSVYSSHLLQSVGRWLGQQFHAANSSISQQVETFKVQHIERISDLPPAEALAAELFPEAMRTLLLHWMGLSDNSTHWKRQSEYPILLLILEFANHNLITGVAHVLYSSLICK
ncbi:uncharacterized protein si:ch211-110p13.9 isoform X1 [Hypomesus transpacificus]|uniref:uncharacterized protein si:ch211-110p13.9 isoform X1 n=1 Tax=Hypomesus transpacificus TaxID=137520 RepID=UPI001F07D523|nr:uncharacterized protein si:ch211-110p13.9 isoform X1 [Hypomesus transpacificus]